MVLTDEERAVAYAVEDDTSDDLPTAVKTYFGLQASCQESYKHL